MQGIYCIQHLKSGRKYYGSSININKRLKDHKKELKKQIHHNIYLQRAVNKYGIDAFSFCIVEETFFENRTDLLKYEQIYLDNNAGGYNMAPAKGGDILSHHPEKHKIRQQILKSHAESMKLMTKEQRKLKFGKAGNQNHNWRDGGTSFKLCPACQQNTISKTAKVCANCRDRTGINNPFFGKHHTEETKQRQREKMSGDNSWIKGIDPIKLPYTKMYELTYPDHKTKIVAGLKVIAEEFEVSTTNIHNIIKRCKNNNYPKRGKLANHIIKEILK